MARKVRAIAAEANKFSALRRDVDLLLEAMLIVCGTPWYEQDPEHNVVMIQRLRRRVRELKKEAGSLWWRERLGL